MKGFAGDGGPAAEAQFGGIFAIAFRGSLLYLCDLGNRRVRVVDLTSGIVKTVAGNGEKGVPADGQPALEQPLVDPRAVAVDANGDLYVLEREGHALRVVSADGKIRTVAGTGAPGFSGDGGPARSAELRGPKHISIDDNDQSVLISDTENHVIRRYSPVDGTISRVAGSGMLGSGGLERTGRPLRAESAAWRASEAALARHLHLRQRESPNYPSGSLTAKPLSSADQ